MSLSDTVVNYIKDKIWERYSERIIACFIAISSSLLSWMRNTAITWADAISAAVLLILMIWLASISRRHGIELTRDEMNRKNSQDEDNRIARDAAANENKRIQEMENQRTRERGLENHNKLYSGRKEAISRAQTDIDRIITPMDHNIAYVVWWGNFSNRINSIQWDIMNDNWARSILNELCDFLNISIKENVNGNTYIQNTLMRIYLKCGDDIIEDYKSRGAENSKWESNRQLYDAKLHKL
jgi:hypothetical protein